MHGFHNNLGQLLSLRSISAIRIICSGRLKVKVTLEGKMRKWSYIELVCAMTCTIMYEFLTNLAQLFSLTSRSAI